jgi:hypothetical protein
VSDISVVRWQGTVNHHSVTFAEVYKWDLNVSLLPDLRILWTYHAYEPEELISGSGIVWANGRLTAVSHTDGSRELASLFKRIIDKKGITFGQIEAELRDMTGYRDP